MASYVWRERAFTTEEAAVTAGLCRATLITWIHRFPHTNFSERRAGNRLFSAKDITALRVAAALNSVMPLAEAIPTAIQHLSHPPNPDSFLVAIDGKTFVTGADTAAAFAIERGTPVVAVGRIAAEVEAACAVLYRREASHHLIKETA